MKRIISALLMSALIISLAGCGDTSSSPSTYSAPDSSDFTSVQGSSSVSTPPTVDSSSADPSDENFAELLDNILVEMEVDETLSQAIVTISNNSSMTFNGSVHVHFKNSSNKSVGNDTIFVEELTAGNWTYARITVSEIANIEMTYNIGKYEFTEGYASDSGTLDDSVSAALAKDFEDSFGGAGNPEWATSWYGYVTKVEVFTTDSNRYSVITVSPDADPDAIDRIGNTIFGNYSKDYELARVLVLDPDGNIVFDRSI